MALPRTLPSAKRAAASKVMDTKGTDAGTSEEVGDVVQRKQALAGGSGVVKPKFGNPIQQIGGMFKKITTNLKQRQAAADSTANAKQDIDAQYQGEQAYKAEQKARALKNKGK